MMLFAILTFVGALLGAVAILVIVRMFWPTTPMSAVLFPGRVPRWAAYIGIPMTLVGLLVWTLGLAARMPRMARFGVGVAVFGASGFIGNWVGGIGGSYALQYITGWPPPAAELPPKK